MDDAVRRLDVGLDDVGDVSLTISDGDAALRGNLEVAPFTVVTGPAVTSAAITFPGTTWYVSTAVSLSLFSGFSRSSTVPGGSLANASFVGAKTVKGPSPESVSANPAAWTAVTSVEKSSLAAAMSTIDWPSAAAVVSVAPAMVVAAVVVSLAAESSSSPLHAPSASRGDCDRGDENGRASVLALHRFVLRSGGCHEAYGGAEPVDVEKTCIRSRR